MSTYELDDATVRRALNLDPEADHNQRIAAEEVLMMEIGKQVPIQPPTKQYAVVRTDQGVFCRADNNDPNADWWGPEENWCRTDAIGRITEVLFEGVDR